MKKTVFIPMGLIMSVLLCPSTYADSTLEYLIHETKAGVGKSQPVLIQGGKVLVRSAGGNEHVDVLYSSAEEKLVIIDHHKHTFMAVDEQQVNQISQQTEDIQPLLQGFGEQLGKLSPQQRKKWEHMLGGNISLDKIAKAAEPIKPTQVVKTGKTKTVAGIVCEQMNVTQGDSPMAEFCLADPVKLNLSRDDYATIRSLFGFTEKIAAKTHGIASQFGVRIPAVAINDLVGIPIEMKDVSGDQRGSLTLHRIVTASIADDLMQIPNGYKAQKFSLWR